jgi:hypothetical protein
MTNRMTEFNTMEKLTKSGAETLVYAHQTNDGNRVILNQLVQDISATHGQITDLSGSIATRQAEFKTIIGQNEYNQMVANILWVWAILFAISAILLFVMKKTDGNYAYYMIAILTLTAITIAYTVIATQLNNHRDPHDWALFDFAGIFGPPTDPFAEKSTCPATVTATEGFVGNPTIAEANAAADAVTLPMQQPSVVLNSSRNSQTTIAGQNGLTFKGQFLNTIGISGDDTNQETLATFQ